MKPAITLFICFFLLVVLLTGFWGVVSELVLPNTAWGLYSREFFANLLASLHGSIVDFFLIAIILYWFEKRRDAKEKAAAEQAEKKIAIERNKEALEDLAHYRGEDASYRTMVVMKRLIALGASPISCPNASLSNLAVQGISLKGAKLYGANFIGSDLQNADLQGATLDAANFSNSNLTNAVVHGASLWKNRGQSTIPAPIASLLLQRSMGSS